LVLLAVGVCFLASGVAISLFHRAQLAQGRARLIWLGLDAAAAGFGIWATHFIAILAFDPGLGAGYDAVLTILSLVIAIVITGVGLFIALSEARAKFIPILAGTVAGGGVAAMHYTGMLALEVPARLTWSVPLVIASVILGLVWAAAALYVASQPVGKGRTLLAATLLTVAIVTMHGRRAICTGSDARAGFVVVLARCAGARPCRGSGNHPRDVLCRRIRRPAHR
jgi:NO-binding membrane sensor protein with MHYT domain